MSNLLKQALISSVCEYEWKKDLLEKIFAPENQEALLAELQAHKELTLDDLRLENAVGRAFMHSKMFWHNYGKIHDLLGKAGVKLGYDDYVQPVKFSYTARSMLECAADSRELAGLFTPEIWKGRRLEMEQLWFHVDSKSRDQVNMRACRRELAAAEGVELREDIVERAGITYDALREHLKTGKVDDMVGRLAAAGLTLTKEDVLAPDRDGDTAFFSATTWDHIEKIAAVLEQNGEYFTKEDFLRTWGGRESVLARGIYSLKLPKVFAPSLWVGRLAEMESLWDEIPPERKGQVKFEEARQEVEDLTYARLVKIDESLTRRELLEIQPWQDAGSGRAEKVMPLGLRGIWRRIEEVQTLLKAKGEGLRFEDFRAQDPRTGLSLLYIGVREGKFSFLGALAAVEGARLTEADLVGKQVNGRSVLDELSDQSKLAELFAPAVWANNVQTMQQVWAQVSENGRKQVPEYGENLRRLNRGALRRLARPHFTTV